MEALDGAYELTLKYLKFLFIGPPRSGKSTFRRRLVKEIVNLHELGESANSESTGVGEGNEVTIMTPKKIFSEHVNIKSPERAEAHQSQWKSMKKLEGGSNNAGVQSDNTDIHSLTHLFFELISTTTKNSSDTQSKNEMTVGEQQPQPTSVIELESKEATNMSSVVKQESISDSKSPTSKKEAEAKPLVSKYKDQEVEEAFNKLTTILQSNSLEKLEELLIIINLMDIGGQPALLEMLPSLTIGPALYLLFFRLDQELDERCEVKFCAQGSTKDIVIDGHYYTKNVMHQSLSSIACFGCYSQEEKISSKILLCGTYKDEAMKKGVEISSVGKELKEELKKTKFSTKELVLSAPHAHLFFSVDNMYGDEDEMSEIRKNFENIIKDHFVPIKVPAVWLMLRVVLHLMNKPIVTLSQCQLIYERLSKQTSVVEESTVKHALRFFHHNVGNLMYYDKIPSLKDTVICDPQVVMDSVSSLIFDRFTESKPIDDIDEFMEKGLFTLDQIADAMKEKQDKHLKVLQLIDLLKDRNILAEIEEIGQESEHTDKQGREEAHEIATKQADEQGSNKQTDEHGRKEAHEIATKQDDGQRRKQTDEQGRKKAHEIASKQDDELNGTQTDEQGSKQASRPINRKFIMPAVLPIARNEDLDWLKKASESQTESDKDEEPKKSERVYHKAPIMIYFSCGFVPFGVFGACMAYLIEPRNKKSLQWQLSDDESVAVYRNMVTFRVEKESTEVFVTLISRPHCFEIQVSVYESVRNEINFQCICPSIQQDIVNALKNITSKWKYLPHNMSEKSLFSGPLFHLAFRCTLAQSHSEHLMKAVVSDGKLTCTCTRGGMKGRFGKHCLVWFDEVS